MQNQKPALFYFRKKLLPLTVFIEKALSDEIKQYHYSQYIAGKPNLRYSCFTFTIELTYRLFYSEQYPHIAVPCAKRRFQLRIFYP